MSYAKELVDNVSQGKMDLDEAIEHACVAGDDFYYCNDDTYSVLFDDGSSVNIETDSTGMTVQSDFRAKDRDENFYTNQQPH